MRWRSSHEVPKSRLRPRLAKMAEMRASSAHQVLAVQRFAEGATTVTPTVLGAQPFPAGVLDPLGPSQRMAFDLLHRLSPAQRAAAHIHDVAPADFTTRQVPRVGAVELPDHVDLGIETYETTDDDRWALRFEKAAPPGEILGRPLPHPHPQPATAR